MEAALKITDINVIGLRPPGGNGGTRTLLEVVTDEGLIGHGCVGYSPTLTSAVLEELQPFYRDASALEVHLSCERMRAHWGDCLTFARVIAVIELALWDIFGHVVELSVGTLLGGHHRQRVTGCAILEFSENGRLEAQIEALKAANCKAFRLHGGDFGRLEPRHDERLIGRAMRAIGEGLTLLVADGTGRPTDLKWAKRTADMLDDHGVQAFEVHFPSCDTASYRQLRDYARLPIAAAIGPRERAEGQALIGAQAVDLLTLDSSRCGGLGAALRLGRCAESFGINPSLRGGHDPFSLAADLHLASAFTDSDLIDLPLASTGLESMVVPHWRLDANGQLEVPQGPGLGVRLDQDALHDGVLNMMH